MHLGVRPASSRSDSNPRPTKKARIEKSSDEDKTATGRKSAKATKPIPTPGDFTPRAENAWKIGPHVSAAGGVENAVLNAASVGANAFAVFVKSQRKWESAALTEESIRTFKERMKAFGYTSDNVLPHGSYLINMANPNDAKREKSYECFLDDLKRCEQLGLRLYNFHPGSSVGAATMEASTSRIAECINRAHKETKSVIVVLENMAGAGNIVGSRFSELGNIIEQVHDKARVGVCLDTCHMYAAGYDITTPEGWEATMAEFDRDVGLKYLRGMHLNDSKGELGSKKDRHENIGLGHLGLRTFARILSDPRTRNIPLCLETPAYDSASGAKNSLATEGVGVWHTEVKVLNRVSGRMPSSGEGAGIGEPLEDEELETCRAEISAAVAQASKLVDGKGRKADGKGATRGAKKTKPGDD